jgi:hypothetical protein
MPKEAKVEDISYGKFRELTMPKIAFEAVDNEDVIPLRDYSEGWNLAGWGKQWSEPVEETSYVDDHHTPEEINDYIKTLDDLIAKIAWIDSHSKSRTVYEKRHISFSTMMFQLTTWRARLFEVLRDNDAILLSHLDLNHIKTSCEYYDQTLNTVIGEIKNNTFYWLLPLLHGPGKWCQRRALRIKLLGDNISSSYKRFKEAAKLKIPFIIKIIETPTEEINDFRFYAFKKNNKKVRPNSEAEFDQIRENFNALWR